MQMRCEPVLTARQPSDSKGEHGVIAKEDDGGEQPPKSLHRLCGWESLDSCSMTSFFGAVMSCQILLLTPFEHRQADELLDSAASSAILISVLLITLTLAFFPSPLPALGISRFSLHNR